MNFDLLMAKLAAANVDKTDAHRASRRQTVRNLVGYHRAALKAGSYPRDFERVNAEIKIKRAWSEYRKSMSCGRR